MMSMVKKNKKEMKECLGMRIADAHNIKSDLAEVQLKDFQALREAISHSEQTKFADKLRSTDQLLLKVSKLAENLRVVFMNVVKQELAPAQMKVLGLFKQCEEPLLIPIWMKSAVAPPRRTSASRRGTGGYAGSVSHHRLLR